MDMDASVTLQTPTHERTDSRSEAEAESNSQQPLPGRRGSQHMLLDEAIITRHSTRLYLPKPVPRSLLERALALAAHAPSNTNSQAWRLFMVTGSALERLKSGLVSAASEEQRVAQTPVLPEEFKQHRSALGRQVYGEGWKIPREDAVLRNYDFFGAPVGVIVCMSAELVGQAAFSVGMYLQTFLLALTERGVGSCVEISVTGYPDVVRREVGIPDSLSILVGVAVGYEDAEAGVNRIKIDRDGVDKTTVWVDR
ncbi:Nitroreductase-like protein [Astrocystis sublimbata]|nr:Nitroreductase-like protein [Astrocystis sublimbata]